LDTSLGVSAEGLILMDLDFKKLARKTKVHYIIVVGDVNEPSILYDKNGKKLAEGEHFEYLKFIENIKKERKRCLIYYKYKNTVSIHNKYGDLIWEGKLEELPTLQNRAFYEKLPKLPEEIKKCKTVLDAIKTMFKDKIVEPTSIIDTDEDVWKTKVTINDNVVMFPEKNAWVACIKLGVPDRTGEEVIALISENFVYLLKTTTEECFKQAQPKTIYICFDGIPPANPKDRCKVINQFRAIAKQYKYQTIDTD